MKVKGSLCKKYVGTVLSFEHQNYTKPTPSFWFKDTAMEIEKEIQEIPFALVFKRHELLALLLGVGRFIAKSMSVKWCTI